MKGDASRVIALVRAATKAVPGTNSPTVGGCCGASRETHPVAGLATADADRLAAMFKALGEPVRLRMMAMIAATDELCVCEITPAFELSPATVSHHLKTLREAGLIDGERRGTFVYYWAQPDALDALADLLGHRCLRAT
ncbi:MAG TPA: metalloregulator ArsR/SmtB family transcription factor [Propioniciclava tarda]|nr:metalloregulator ArsR/SmtB family transcription factor [Propioniciclava tarda]HQD60701.1 metalloregulator ArsR/SmtB family transcription factor [Propioniciclava tarda]